MVRLVALRADVVRVIAGTPMTRTVFGKGMP